MGDIIAISFYPFRGERYSLSLLGAALSRSGDIVVTVVDMKMECSYS